MLTASATSRPAWKNSTVSGAADASRRKKLPSPKNSCGAPACSVISMDMGSALPFAEEVGAGHHGHDGRQHHDGALIECAGLVGLRLRVGVGHRLL
eukprot:24774-Eustigmatos_ZCMA.PRE.1